MKAQVPTLAFSLALSWIALGLCAPHAAHAKYLRLVPRHDIQVQETKKQVVVSWTVTNDGDENAKDVVLDLPQLNESYPLSKDLAPKTDGRHEMTIPFDRLKIREKGEYALIYRVLYKDANFYPFSAPYVAMILLPPAPSRGLQIQFEDSEDGLFELADSLRISFELFNRSSVPVQVTQVEPVFASEIPTRISWKGSESGLRTLEPDASVRGTLELERKGALTGSMYIVGLVASGVSGGVGGAEAKHFAQQADFRVSVRDSSMTPRRALGYLIAAVSIAVIAGWAVQQIRKRKA